MQNLFKDGDKILCQLKCLMTRPVLTFVSSCLFGLRTSLHGLVRKNMETICSVEPNQFPHKPMIVDQEASHHRRAHHTSPQHTLPYQTDDTLTIDMPYHTNATQCHTMPCPSTPCNITLYKDQGASPTLFLLTRRVSLLPSLLCATSWFVPL